MLVSLVKNSQLKQKNKELSPASLVLVSDYGSVLPPIESQIVSDIFTGKALATFEVLTKDLSKAIVFDDLSAYIDATFGKNAKVVYKVLFEAQSLTISYLSQSLKVPRDVARMFIDELIKAGAYRKYFSYWKRTKEFGEWLLTKLQ